MTVFTAEEHTDSTLQRWQIWTGQTLEGEQLLQLIQIAIAIAIAGHHTLQKKTEEWTGFMIFFSRVFILIAR